MTVGQLLANADSRELSAWMVFLERDAEIREDRRKRAEEDRKILGEE
jgi:hypothetical protein